MKTLLDFWEYIAAPFSKGVATVLVQGAGGGKVV